jgi:REP element-mobilizing transposase RayT
MTADDRKKRLRRLDRVFLRTPIYFVTTCTEKRRSILVEQSVHDAFIRFAEEGVHRGAWLGAYVLMPNHLHAFVGFDNQQIQLSAWMKSLKNTLSKTLRLNGVAGPALAKGIFRSRFAKRGIIRRKVAVCTPESGTCWTGEKPGGLAILG